MASITLTGYHAQKNMYGCKLGGAEYIQCTPAEVTHIAVLSEFPTANNVYSCIVYTNTDVFASDNDITADVTYSPIMPCVCTATLTTDSDATTEDTCALTGTGENIYNIDIIDYSYLTDRVTSQYRVTT